MKKIIFTFLLTLSFYSYSENWQDKWSESLVLMEKNQFEEAKSSLDQAIALMEVQQNHAYLYVDRARLNLILGSSDVLEDLDRAFLSDQLDLNEKIRAVATKLVVLGSLGIETDVLENLKIFGSLNQQPTMELKDSKLLIRNAPINEFYRKLMTCYLIHSGVCYDKDDFNWLKSGMLIAEKINHCGCQKCIDAYAKTRDCDACHLVINPGKENIVIDQFIFEAVKYCGREVKQLDNQIAFLTALVQIQGMGKAIEFSPNVFDSIFESIDKSAPIFWD